ncbi:mucoidy inhibitor MuiA family protein [Rhodocytophaga rosea]|uniref:Mucoidy inhibitor MuiA family protein n=1 Tax=Rhodocytophaga rosea TaxID=2704465 RepID=A0A6C0GFH4_9BACT|nr:mucoidy inhibitor MuiA family protein [Rhodocytophaga rosea]QHT66781.1 mucoidy inhibitor MuiA family protein [Rhodocytophaga rosea]
MKNAYQVILYFSLWTASSLSLLAQNNQPISAQLKHVTVFRDKAQITSSATASLPEGVTQLQIEGLPAQIDKQSINVTAKGNIIILGVKHQVNYTRPQKKSVRLIQLEDSLTLYTSRLERYTYTKDVLTKEQQMLMSNQAIGGTQTGVSVEKLKQMADFFRTRLTEINEKLIENERNLREAQTQVARMQNQLNELTNKRNQPSSEIIVSVSAKNNNTPAELELDYIVPNAGWVPVYDIRASEGKNQVQLSYKANVFQRTGVDWNNTRITLSTANPSQGGTQPTLNPMFASLYQPEIMYGASNARKKYKAGAAPSIADDLQGRVPGVAVEESETVADYTQVQETGLSVEFDIALPYTIISGGSPQLVDIQAHELPASYSYLAVPKLDGDAFLTALVSGWEKYNLISGNANIYFGGTFVGESFLDARQTGDTLRLSLGRDKKLLIKREKINEFSSKKTIGSSGKHLLTALLCAIPKKNLSV